MIKQGFQKLVQAMNRIRQATTTGVIIAYLLFTVVLGILTGIGLSAFNLLPSFLTKLFSCAGYLVCLFEKNEGKGRTEGS